MTGFLCSSSKRMLAEPEKVTEGRRSEQTADDLGEDLLELSERVIVR